MITAFDFRRTPVTTMNKSLWMLKTLPALLLAGVGFFCLNYTQGFGIEHHTEWAKSHGFPEPTYPIFLTGVVVLAVGSGIAGYVVGR